MFLPTRKFALASLVPLGTLLSACPDGGLPDDGENQNARASLSVQFVGGVRRLDADGSSKVRIVVTARAQDGTPANSDIRVEADAGFVGEEGETLDSDAVTLTPEDGQASLEFTCEPWSNDDVTITFSNADATATAVVACEEPRGQATITIQGPPGGAIRNGAPAPVSIRVVEVTGLPASGDEVVVSIDGGDGDAVVSSGGTSGASVTAALDADGRATVQVDAPIDLEPTEYSLIVGYRPIASRPLEEKTTTLTNTLVDRSSVEMTVVDGMAPGSASVAGGEPASVVVEVLDVNGLPAANGSVVLTVDGPGNAVLSAGDESGSSITVALDAAGAADFVVDPPAGVEDAVYTVTASYEILEDVLVTEGTFELTNIFEDDSDLSVTGPTALEAGTSASLSLAVLSASGNPAAFETVDISVVGGLGTATVTAGSRTGAALTAIPLDANGLLAMTVNAPVTPAPAEYTLTVNYQVFPGLLAKQEVIDIVVTEAGGLTLNLEAADAEVRSDIPLERSTSMKVTFTRSGTRPSGALVTLRVPDVDASRIRFSPRPGQTGTQVVLAAADFSATGEATVGLEAIANSPSATVSIIATGTDNDPNTADVTTTFAVDVKRAPILQSMVALAPNPAVIGVRGGSTRSTSVVSFQLYDDADQPMAGVPVSFRTNATADRQVSVGLSAVSDAAGLVSTVLSAGTVAGPVSVIATATPVSPDPTATAPTLTVQSPPIAVTGGLPNFLSSFITCAQAVENLEGATFGCSLTLVDRFTNLVDGQVVQFRAEGSGTNATGTTGNGEVTATMVLDDGDTLSGASLPYWSHGFLPDITNTEADPLNPFVTNFIGCLDGTVDTGCDILRMCSSTDPRVNKYCPLEPSCVPDAVEARNKLLGSPTGTVVALTFPPSGNAPDTEDNLQAYIDNHRSCGFPVSCFTGILANREGVAEIPGDECPVAAGCMDFNPNTPCPQDGLVTVVATTRGEESFVDANGNGRFDSGEDFIDLPEPFLDKNESCGFDDYAGAERFQFTTSERIRHTDLFSDVNNDGKFGFGIDAATGRLLEGNGVYDSDTETFFASKALLVGSPTRARIIAGAACDAGTEACLENAYGANGYLPNPAPAFGGKECLIDSDCGGGKCIDGGRCSERTRTGISPRDLDTTLEGHIDPNADDYFPPESVEVFFRVEDANGNCPSPDFAASVTAEVEDGPVKVTPLTFPLDALACGMNVRSNLIRPHCEEATSLGAPTGSFVVTAECTEAGTFFADVTVGLGDGPPGLISFEVVCSGEVAGAAN